MPEYRVPLKISLEHYKMVLDDLWRCDKDDICTPAPFSILSQSTAGASNSTNQSFG